MLHLWADTKWQRAGKLGFSEVEQDMGLRPEVDLEEAPLLACSDPQPLLLTHCFLSLPSALGQHDPPDAIPHSFRFQCHLLGGHPQPLPHQWGHPKPFSHQWGHPQPFPHQRGYPFRHHSQLWHHWEQCGAQVHGSFLLSGLQEWPPLDSELL